MVIFHTYVSLPEGILTYVHALIEWEKTGALASHPLYPLVLCTFPPQVTYVVKVTITGNPFTPIV